MINSKYFKSYANAEEIGIYHMNSPMGLPPHDIELQNVQFVMLLRNLDLSRE
jgi:hypothetical protein